MLKGVVLFLQPTPPPPPPKDLVCISSNKQDKLPSIWKGFLGSIDVEKDLLLQKSVNHKVFEMLLSEHLEPPCSSQRRPASEDELMSKDELKSLQYVGGYVPHSLLKKYEN